MSKQRKFAVFIPGYKEDNVIVDVARRALEQSYPEELFDVFIIADSFQELTLDKLKRLPINLIEVSFDVSTKSKALNKAMEMVDGNYQVALILDADNVMEFDFLTQINDAFNKGYRVVQGHRVAKNTNTTMAVLDAMSEEINNQIFRKGHRALGLSSALIGSGMAFDYQLFKKLMLQINAVGGFDKELELNLLKNRVTIEYVPNALVFDEKVQKTEVFANQRKRWLSAQFIYFSRFIGLGLKELFSKGNFDFFDKVYQMITPPRLILLGLSGVLATISFLMSFLQVDASLLLPAWVWYSCLGVTSMALILAIPRRFFNAQFWMALVNLPKTFVVMFAALFKLKGANKKFIHTQHGAEMRV